jgi:S1-C subfamily serine protease
MAMRSHWRFSLFIISIVVMRILPSIAAIAADSANAFYQQQNGTDADPNLHSLDEYIRNGIVTVSPLGLELREEQRKLKSGAPTNGLLIVGVFKGSPAAEAGLKGVQETPQQILRGLAVAGSIVFPPAIIVLPIAASIPIGRDGDLIIAVDGARITNVLGFEDEIRDVKPGEIVYLTVVRAGARMQVQVVVPAIAQQTTLLRET